MYLFTRKSFPVFLVSFYLGLAGYSAFALDVPLARIIDDSALRAAMRDSWLTESPGRVLAKTRTRYNLAGGGRVELRAEEGRSEFIVVFARELTGGRTGERPVPTGQFPFYSQGSWVFTRRKDTGAVTKVGVYLRSDSNTYIQFRPQPANSDKCLMDVILYNAYIVNSLPLPVSMERLYTMPLAEILSLAGDKFPRRYFEPDPADFGEQRLFIARVRERLPELEFADDGAIDRDGRYVYINGGEEQRGQKGLNCSGFSKWLIDGILRPVTGERLAIPPLKAPFGKRGSSFTDPWEELRDPFFGLDWIRNLASQAGTVLRSPVFSDLEEIEVRREPFSRIILRDRISAVSHYPGFLENAGYGVEGLQPLLYTLAIDEPGRFYLAAVNNESPARRPAMRQYFHIIAFVPYFDEYGYFQIAVFESAEETSFNAFRSRYPPVERIVDGERVIYPNGHYVNLVRIPLETAFDP